MTRSVGLSGPGKAKSQSRTPECLYPQTRRTSQVLTAITLGWSGRELIFSISTSKVWGLHTNALRGHSTCVNLRQAPQARHVADIFAVMLTPHHRKCQVRRVVRLGTGPHLGEQYTFELLRSAWMVGKDLFHENFFLICQPARSIAIAGIIATSFPYRHNMALQLVHGPGRSFRRAYNYSRHASLASKKDYVHATFPCLKRCPATVAATWKSAWSSCDICVEASRTSRMRHLQAGSLDRDRKPASQAFKDDTLRLGTKFLCRAVQVFV